MSTTQTSFYILHCEDTIEGILSALYDGFVLKKKLPAPYTDNISIAIGENNTFDLFSEWIELKPSHEKASITASTIHRQLGSEVYKAVFYTLCHFSPDRGTILMGFLARAFAKGERVLNRLSDTYAMRVMELSRKVSNEAHYFHEFVRFTKVEQTFYSRIEPKCSVLPLISPHFADRFPCENWIIYDKTHNLGSVHKAGGSFVLLSDPALDIELCEYRNQDDYHHLWKLFFHTIAIRERENTKCQNNLLPKWYRKNMDEF